MLINLYTTWDSIQDINNGGEGKGHAKRYVNVDHILVSFDTELYEVLKVSGEDLYYIYKKIK